MRFNNDIIEIIKHRMPDGARVVEASSFDAFVVNVSWKLDDDPERPNKPSRTLSIRVSHEAMEDFASATELKRAEALRRISDFIAKKMATFDPKHDVPKYQPPPVETWVVSTHVLFGVG